MRKAWFLIPFLSFAFTVAVSAQQSDVSAERCCPDLADKGTHSEVATPIRFDGMYVGQFKDNNLYLRFFDDGEVFGVNGKITRTVSDLKKWRIPKQFTYSLTGNKVTMRFVHPDGRVYIGEGIIDGNTLSVDFDGVGVVFVYTFVPEKK